MSAASGAKARQVRFELRDERVAYSVFDRSPAPTAATRISASDQDGLERCVNALKQFRRIATRYEKTTRAFLSMLCTGAARLRIKTVNTA